MNEFETTLAEAIRQSVNDWSEGTERSQQKKIGVSSLGFCSERLRRELDGQQPEGGINANKMFIGTAVGDYLERAQRLIWPNAIFQSEVTVTLVGDMRTYELMGHPDVVIPPCEQFPGGAVLDNKAPGTLVWVRRKETADDSYQYQRNLYAKAAYDAGMLGDGPIEDVLVGNIYYDRSGVDATPHVQIEPYDPNVLFEAAQWLDEVVLALLAGEEARKEPERRVCEAACGFYQKCRAYDTDAEGLIQQPETLAAIDLYVEAGAMERDAKKMKNAAMIRLQGVEGHTPDFSLRWVHVNGGSVSYNREAYQRLSLTKKKK